MLMLVTIFQSTWKNTGLYRNSSERVVVILDPIKTMIHGISGDGDSVQDENNVKPESKSMILEQIDNYYIGALLLLISLNSMFIIFQFKKRMLQIKLAGLNYLLLCGVMVIYYLSIKNANGIISEVGSGQFLIGFYVPLIAIILNFLVIRFIKKDEALVRSVDRIR